MIFGLVAAIALLIVAVVRTQAEAYRQTRTADWIGVAFMACVTLFIAYDVWS